MAYSYDDPALCERERQMFREAVRECSGSIRCKYCREKISPGEDYYLIRGSGNAIHRDCAFYGISFTEVVELCDDIAELRTAGS